MSRQTGTGRSRTPGWFPAAALAACCLWTSGLRGQEDLYGPGLQGDALANTVLGKWGIEVAYRFRAETAGTLRGIRVFFIWSHLKSGYHGGSGGLIKVELQEDDGSPSHLPSGRALASCLHPIRLTWDDSGFYPFLTLAPAPVLRAGALYHLVFSNQDPDGERNFVSLNAVFTRAASQPQQPRFQDRDWAMLMRSRGKPQWVLRRTPGTSEGFTPILEVTTSAGRQGVGYMEFWVHDPKPISGRAAVREVFTVSGRSRKVTGVRARVRHLAGAPELSFRLERQDGTLVAQGQTQAQPGALDWVGAAFPAPVTLTSGSTYHLLLQATPPSRFEAYPMRKGSDKGFGATTLFADGHAEFSGGHGWTGWDPWLRWNRLDSDLQFYFTLEGGPG